MDCATYNATYGKGRWRRSRTTTVTPTRTKPRRSRLTGPTVVGRRSLYRDARCMLAVWAGGGAQAASCLVFFFTTWSLGGPDTFPGTVFSSRVVFVTVPGPRNCPTRPTTAKSLPFFIRDDGDLGRPSWKAALLTPPITPSYARVDGGSLKLAIARAEAI